MKKRNQIKRIILALLHHIDEFIQKICILVNLKNHHKNIRKIGILKSIINPCLDLLDKTIRLDR